MVLERSLYHYFEHGYVCVRHLSVLTMKPDMPHFQWLLVTASAARMTGSGAGAGANLHFDVATT